VSELDPGFIDAQLVQGLHDYIVGSLPAYWRFVGVLVGFHATRTRASGGWSWSPKRAGQPHRRPDPAVRRVPPERRPQRAVVLLEGLIRRFPGNYLLPMELAQMYSDLGNKEKALAPLRQLERQKHSGASGFAQLRMEKIYYAEGTIEFWYNDLDTALANMKQAHFRRRGTGPEYGSAGLDAPGPDLRSEGAARAGDRGVPAPMAFAPDSDAARESRQYLVSPYRRKQRG